MTQQGVSFGGKPVMMGVNNVSFSVRDAAGKTTLVTRPLFAKASPEPAGCNRFNVGLGRVRENYAMASDRYGSLFANTTVVCGTENGFTIEAHGEYLEGDTGLAGVDVMHSIGALGTASLAVAASESADKKIGESGWLLRAGLQRSNDRFEVNLRARLQSPDFRELGVGPVLDPMTSQLLAGIGAKLSESNTLGIAYANRTTAAFQRIDVIAMTQTIELGSKGSKGKLSIVADRAVRDDSNASVKVSYVRALRE